MPDVTNVNKALAAIEADEASAIVYAILALRDQDHEVLVQQRKHHRENIQQAADFRAENEARFQREMQKVKLPVRNGTGKAFVVPGHAIAMQPGWGERATTELIFVGGAVIEVDGEPEEVKAILEGA